MLMMMMMMIYDDGSVILDDDDSIYNDVDDDKDGNILWRMKGSVTNDDRTYDDKSLCFYAYNI
jgi:hypothetical protein